MPDNTWTIEYRGTRQSCEEWGIEDLQFSFVSQQADELSFTLPGAAFDADRVFAYGSTVKVFKKNVQWFVGTIIKPRLRGESTGEYQEYVGVGPWYFLENKIFEQVWRYYLNGNNQPQADYTSHIILNGSVDGLSLITTGEQIRRALQWVIDGFPLGAPPFAIGNITPAILPPVDEIRDLSVAEVIRRQLRWHPDAVTWFDYSTEVPTFHCKRYDELPAVSVKIPPSAKPDGTNVQEISFESREDLQRPSVALKYEIRTTVDDEERLSVVKEVAPAGATGREIGAMVATIDLQGGKVTTLKAEIVSAPIPADLKSDASLDWWKSRIPELSVPEVVAVKIVDADRLWIDDQGNSHAFDGTGPVALPYELMRGQITEDWMPGIAQRERMTLKVQFSLYDGDQSKVPTAKLRGIIDKMFIKEITTTDLPSDVYQGPQKLEQRGDPLVLGLAQALHDAISILHFSGTIKIVDQEVAGDIRPGKVINLFGARAEWNTMRALVQQASEAAANGETTITVGPPEHLGISDLISLLRVNRLRDRTGTPGAQGSGSVSDGGGGSLGKQMPIADRSPGGTIYSMIVIASGAGIVTIDPGSGRATFQSGAAGAEKVVAVDMGAGSITLTDASQAGRSIALELAKCFGGGKNRALTIAETAVCVTENGAKVTKHRLGLMSEIY